MRLKLGIATFVGACLVAASPAAAADYAADPPVFASPATSPLMDPCQYQPESGAEGAEKNYKDTEVEPQVAVNPKDPDNVIGVFQEDRWAGGGAHGLLASVSMSGGSSYLNDWAEFSACSDKPETPYFEHLPRATDPWVSFDAAGRAYQVGLPIIDGSLTGESAVTVSTSTDKGLTWSDPVDVTRNDSGLQFNDKQSITANPYSAGHAYVTWIQGNLPGENHSFNKLAHAFSYRGSPMIARTTDGGASFSAPKPMSNANMYAQGNQIVVLPSGNLLDVQAILFKGSGIQPNLNGVYMAVMRSTDDGKHWSAPSRIAKLGTVGVSADGKPLRVGDYLPDITVDSVTGNVFVTWADGMGGPTNKIVMSRSRDGGRHWTAPVIVSHHDTAQSFNHAITVANDGELALLYYDTARNQPGSADGIPTDVYLRHSGDAGQTWSTPQLLTSFDFAKAPVARGHFVGDYQGLEAIGPRSLIAFFGVAGTTPDSADVISLRLNR